MARYGLIGKNIDYSFSRKYFGEKFAALGLDHTYENFDLTDETALQEFLKDLPDVQGLNVTIPYKTSVMQYLDRIDPTASAIGAVNTIAIAADGSTTGYNTDHIGFARALWPFLPLKQPSVLILGSGGASRAVIYALDQLGIRSRVVSRKSGSELNYEQLDSRVIEAHSLLVNCTPLGTYPNTDRCPPIPYDLLDQDHLLFDLVYNPENTRFMELGAQRGARTTNGFSMLVEQAEAAWHIWQKDN